VRAVGQAAGAQIGPGGGKKGRGENGVSEQEREVRRERVGEKRRFSARGEPGCLGVEEEPGRLRGADPRDGRRTRPSSYCRGCSTPTGWNERNV